MPNSVEIQDKIGLTERFKSVRKQSVRLCSSLHAEDYVVQPVEDVSPPKWHLAHTTWFFETFILLPFDTSYKLFHKDYPLLFNSYYIAAGERWVRAGRGHLTRPTVDEVFRYRAYVDTAMEAFLERSELTDRVRYILEVGLHHEQQHQELLLYDIKYILGHNPLFPGYREAKAPIHQPKNRDWLPVAEGVYSIGFEGDGFCYDNERERHKVFLHGYEIAAHPVTVGEYLEFMEDGGYEKHQLWLSEGWDWVNQQPVRAPMYWVRESQAWWHYTLGGLKKPDPDAPVSHISYFEADAFARWKRCRLPTEPEWEIAARMYEPQIPEAANFVDGQYYAPFMGRECGFFGNLWEWTSSAYLPYPYYSAEEGALGEYNGKFMINQMVLRGGSYATPRDHIRHTYRNFFHPHLKWLFNGIRLARYI